MHPPVVTTIDHPLGIDAAKFSELVRDKSGGKMKVKVFPGGTLGGGSGHFIIAGWHDRSDDRVAGSLGGYGQGLHHP